LEAFLATATKEETVTRKLIWVVALAAVAAMALVSGAAARDGDKTVQGTCTAASISKLKLAPRDGRIEVEFEVDSNVNGQRWNVQLRDNGTSVFKGAATTQPPSGSFVVRRTIANQAGTDTVRAIAMNAVTGETCRASASV
jgi:type 1 fimbria pilin